MTCDPVDDPLDRAGEGRPVFGLMVHDETLAADTKLTPVPVGKIKLPWGQRYPQIDGRSIGCTRPHQVP